MLQRYDPRNASIHVFIGDRLYQRKDAKISVFDSVVQGGDAVWEGLRLYPQGILHLDKHLKRLKESAHALGFAAVPDETFIRSAIRDTLEANGMSDEVHIRLTLTRGEKVTSGMDPRLNQFGCCLIVLAEWKPLVYDNSNGIRLITSSQRRNAPQFLDSKIHHNNLLNNIIAKMQANVAGADAAIMLDDHGFISELNDTNLFVIKDGCVMTPRADACLPGISRAMTIDVALAEGWKVQQRNISLTEFYNADAAFATGTMGALTPIVEADGRAIGNGDGIKQFKALNTAYIKSIPRHCQHP